MHGVILLPDATSCDKNLNILYYQHSNLVEGIYKEKNWATICDFQQYGILTSVDSDEPV